MGDSIVIHTTTDGRLAAGTTVEDVEGRMEALRGTDQVVVHLHGGLVSRAAGLATANRLGPVYEEFARPVFFVWESGLRESPVNNVDELISGLAGIAQEAIFKRLFRTISKWSVGKLRTTAGLKAAGQLDLPDDVSHAIELQRANQGEIPYADFVPVDDLDPVAEPEHAGLETDLAEDPRLAAELAAVLLGHSREDEKGDRLKAALPKVTPVESRIDTEVLDELEGAFTPGEKGLFSTALLAKKAGAVFTRVVDRYRKGRDHGLYPTIFEELARELYAAHVGAVIWKIMKQDTHDTFQQVDGETRGGELFLRGLARLGAERPKRLVLVGHSTGAVFINEMLVATREARARGDLPADFAYTGVVFLAPACTFKDFAEVLPREGEEPLFENFRMFTMDDEHERADRLASVFYPRSLLYLVSGVLEPEPDIPLVGMERFHALQPRDAFATLLPEIPFVRTFCAAPLRAIWSPSAPEAALGQQADAIRHGAFDDTRQGVQGQQRSAVDSIRHLLQKGWD